MEKFSTTSKFVSAGAVLVLGMGISAAVMTSSANADESHTKIAHILHSASVIPPAVLPSSIKAPFISGIGSGDETDESSRASSSGDDSEADSGTSSGASIGGSDD